MESGNMSTGTSDKLYSLMADRLERQGGSLPCTMEALRVYSTEPRADIDYLKLINLDNRSFFDACYILSFNTFPPAQYLEKWQDDIESLPKEEFHKKFINSFMQLGNISVFHVRLRNCTCLDVPAVVRPGFGTRVRSWIYRTLHPLYSRLPDSLKKTLKKIFRVQFFVR